MKIFSSLLISFFLFLAFASSTYANGVSPKRFEYCANMLSFVIPKGIDAKSIEQQSGPASCRDKLFVRSKLNAQRVTISRFVGYVEPKTLRDYIEIKKIDLDYLEESKLKISKKMHKEVNYHLTFLRMDKNDVSLTIETIYWIDGDGYIAFVEKSFLASKKDIASVDFYFTLNPNNSEEVLFNSALEQLFLSMEINW